jgi:hypothetical protein
MGVESTDHFGVTLACEVTRQRERVTEVNRPNRIARRMDGNSDRLDAEQIVRTVLGETSTASRFPRAGSFIQQLWNRQRRSPSRNKSIGTSSPARSPRGRICFALHDRPGFAASAQGSAHRAWPKGAAGFLRLSKQFTAPSSSTCQTGEEMRLPRSPGVGQTCFVSSEVPPKVTSHWDSRLDPGPPQSLRDRTELSEWVGWTSRSHEPLTYGPRVGKGVGGCRY